MKKFSLALIFLATTLLGWSQRPINQMERPQPNTIVVMETTVGQITLMLYGDTPLHRDNFIKLVKNQTYDGLLFHRVIKNFMIQGGDPTSANAKPGEMLGSGTLGYTIPAEITPKHIHKRGALCAARQGDNVNPRRESSASQFYIVQGDKWSDEQLKMMEERYGKKFDDQQRKIYTTIGGTPHLDGEYTVFGEVIDGLEVVDKIASVETDRNNRPLKDIRILKVTIKQ